MLRIGERLPNWAALVGLVGTGQAIYSGEEGGEWTEQGISVVVAKHFKGQDNVAIWVSEFGAR